MKIARTSNHGDLNTQVGNEHVRKIVGKYELGLRNECRRNCVHLWTTNVISNT